MQLPDGPSTTPFPVYDKPLTYAIGHLSVNGEPSAPPGREERSTEGWAAMMSPRSAAEARAAMVSPYEYTYGDDAFRQSALFSPGAQSPPSYGEPVDSRVGGRFGTGCWIVTRIIRNVASVAAAFSFYWTCSPAHTNHLTSPSPPSRVLFII